MRLAEAPAAARLADALGCSEVRETHVSWVFLTPTRAYKLKKPVRFAFVDQSTPDRRRALCEEEVRVNAALAADVVLGVRAVVPAGDSFALAGTEATDAVDWVVEMRRFDESRTLAALLARGPLPDAHLDAVGRRVADFHAEAARVPDGPDLLARLDANLDELARVAADMLPPARLRAARRAARSFVAAHGPELEARIASGRVIDGHGDLRAEHVVLEDGRVTIVDRLEFDARLRHVDVADDLAFLVMDLEACGAREAADEMVARYRAAGGDPGRPSLIAFFAAYRAQVRAKVEVLRGRDAVAADLIRLSGALEWRARGPLLLVVCGPPASGKTTLARAIADESGLPRLSSDEVRSAVAPAGSGGRYGAAQRVAVYRVLAERAMPAVRSAGGVIVDATFGAPDLRAAFLDALDDDMRRAIRVVECDAPLPVRLHRAAQRAALGRDASEADAHVTARLAQDYTPLVGVGPRTVIHTERAPGGQSDDVAAWLDGMLEGSSAPSAT